jgi:hypothetical protein
MAFHYEADKDEIRKITFSLLANRNETHRNEHTKGQGVVGDSLAPSFQ